MSRRNRARAMRGARRYAAVTASAATNTRGLTGDELAQRARHSA